MPAQFLCVCRHCLGQSPEGIYFKQIRTVTAHIAKYGTENMDASQSRISSAAAEPSRTDYTEADVSRALQLILSGAQLPSRSPDERTRRVEPGLQSSSHDAGGPQFEQDSNNMSDPPSFHAEESQNGGQDLSTHAGRHSHDGEHSDSDDEPDPDCREQMEREPSQDEDVSHHNHNDSSSEDDPPANDSDDTGTTPEYHIEEIQIARKFIMALERASPDDLDPEIREQIQNPPSFLPTLSVSQRHALDVFLATTNASEETYDLVHAAYMWRHPSDPTTGTESDMYSLYQVKKLVRSLSGVVPVAHDMCYKSCAGFMGPFSHLRICPFCGEDRFTTPDGSIPRKQFQTIPIGPQLQALWRSPEGADAMQYRRVYTQRTVAF
ncbi:hypothetical protein BDZ89DRAFT_1173938 [Hymenopellis radicata]|nr:hypothetical protein BDZ89DRAFT_1173938 [Hymenopellis radicata]